MQQGTLADKGIRYRVRLGPYDNTDELNRQLCRPGLYYAREGDTISGNPLTSAELTLSTHFAYREKFLWGKFERMSLGSNIRHSISTSPYGPKGFFGSEYEYFKIRMKISDKLETNPLGYLKYRFTIGKIFGTLPYPLLKLHEGNETYAYDPLSFNMMNYYEFVSDEYVSLFAEQHFQGFFLNRIPLMRQIALARSGRMQYIIRTAFR